MGNSRTSQQGKASGNIRQLILGSGLGLAVKDGMLVTDAGLSHRSPYERMSLLTDDQWLVMAEVAPPDQKPQRQGPPAYRLHKDPARHNRRPEVSLEAHGADPTGQNGICGPHTRSTTHRGYNHVQETKVASTLTPGVDESDVLVRHRLNPAGAAHHVSEPLGLVHVSVPAVAQWGLEDPTPRSPPEVPWPKTASTGGPAPTSVLADHCTQRPEPVVL